MQQDQVLTKFFWLSLLNEQQHAQHVHTLSYADTLYKTCVKRGNKTYVHFEILRTIYFYHQQQF